MGTLVNIIHFRARAGRSCALVSLTTRRDATLIRAKQWLAIALLLGASLIISACGAQDSTSLEGRDTRMIAIGDSFLAFQRGSGGSVIDLLEESIGEDIHDRSVLGARFKLRGSKPDQGGIARHYFEGPWEWAIVNGGGNNFWRVCNCKKCDDTIERLISEDGTAGAIPSLVQRVRADGAQVIYLSYLHSPGFETPVDHCEEEAEAFETRLARMAARDIGVHFINNSDLVPEGDTSFHWRDLIHLSDRGAQAVAQRIEEKLREEGFVPRTEIEQEQRQNAAEEGGAVGDEDSRGEEVGPADEALPEQATSEPKNDEPANSEPETGESAAKGQAISDAPAIPAESGSSSRAGQRDGAAIES